MSRTGIERLRGLYVEWIGGDYIVALSDMIQETADQIEREHAEELAALKALDPERLTHTPPDTQERIDDDATMPAATYCVSHGLVESDTDVDEATLFETHITDLLHRQRELDRRKLGGDAE